MTIYLSIRSLSQLRSTCARGALLRWLTLHHCLVLGLTPDINQTPCVFHFVSAFRFLLGAFCTRQLPVLRPRGGRRLWHLLQPSQELASLHHHVLARLSDHRLSAFRRALGTSAALHAQAAGCDATGGQVIDAAHASIATSLG